MGMGISVFLFGLTMALHLLGVNLDISLNVSWDVLKEKAEISEARSRAIVSHVSSMKCKLYGAARLPAFSVDGDFVIGGVFSIHNYIQTMKHNYTTMPEPLKCRGRLVRGRGWG